MKLEGKSELFRMLGSLAGINTDVPREPDRCQPCPECGDGYKDCKCPLANTYRQVDGSEATVCPKCLNTGYRRNWQGRNVQCDDCWNDMTSDSGTGSKK
jgi:hypothetical protein